MLNADVRVSLQRRLLKRAATYVVGLESDLDKLRDQTRSWAASTVSYGGVHQTPVHIEVNPFEKASVEDYVQTENDLFGKVIVAVSALACELRFLSHEAKLRFLDPLLYYSEDHLGSQSTVSLGRFLPFLQELTCFKIRCKEVITLFVQQLGALAERDFSSSSMLFLYDCFTELLVCLITADTIIKANNALREHWATYKASLNACSHSSATAAKVGVNDNDIKDIDGFLVSLEREILSGSIFIDCVQYLGKLNVSRKFVDGLASTIQASASDIENVTLQNQDPGRIGARVVGMGALLVIHGLVSRGVDKRLLKIYLDSCRIAPIAALWRNLSVYPADVILQMIPDVSKHVDRKQLQTVQLAKEGILLARLQNLSKDVSSFRADAMEWIEKISLLAKEAEPVMDEELTRTLRSVLLLARKVQNSVTQLFHFHSVLLKPLSRITLLLIGSMMEVLMVLSGSHQIFNCTIALLIDRIIDLTTTRMHKACHNLEKRLANEKRIGALDQVDAFTALKISQQILVSGPLTEQRKAVLRICLGVCVSMKKWPSEEVMNLQTLLLLLEDLSTFQKSFRSACDTTIFYWNRQVLRPYLEEIYQNPSQASKLFSVLAAFEASAAPLHSVRHEVPEVLIKKFSEEVRKDLDAGIINTLCSEVEINLRLLVHSHLSLPDRNPFDSAVRDLRQFLFLDPVFVLNDCICIRDQVEIYLDRTFYDLTTVALHDWKTYDEMRSLAFHLYGLNVLQAHLPCQTLEQGADILEIMRNIASFVTVYAYNLNNQVFVERVSNSKHLNTIGIRHVANSLRTHGIGIMNTTVNYTYQFLRKKFNFFSQFMFDEHIKSRLIKDIKIFKEMKQSDAMAKYPFDRAEKFNKAIRTLGVSADGQTRLDQFRTLITHIGNAMGFVRTVRSGGLHHCSKAICFVPDLDDIESFETLAKEEVVDADTTAAKDLDEVVAMLTKNFSDGTGFFKLLMEVFSAEFRSSKNRHLQNFYIIIPPLMVNFVDHLVTCKERLHKKNPSGLVLFTDDGFAMGIAYILALLDQNAAFDSLNWIDAVRSKFQQEAAAAAQGNRSQVSNNRTEAESDEKLKQALKLTARRLDSYVKEFDLLFYSLSSARIFFKSVPISPQNPTPAGDASVGVQLESTTNIP